MHKPGVPWVMTITLECTIGRPTEAETLSLRIISAHARMRTPFDFSAQLTTSTVSTAAQA